MTKYLAGVLSVIAGGVLLVAYGLLSPRTTAFSYPNQNPYSAQAAYAYGAQQPFAVGSAVPCANGMQVANPYGNQYLQNGVMPMAVSAQPVRTVEVVERTPVVRRQATRTVVTRAAPRRDWKKNALVIGGSAATAAGIGGLIGGKKGALIGAALGGGAGTLYATRRR